MRARWRTGLPWTLASQAGATLVARGVPEVLRDPTDTRMGLLLVGAAGVVVLWSVAVQRWAPAPENASRLHAGWTDVGRWVLWMGTWCLSLLGIIALGYALHGFWGDRTSRDVMVALTLGIWSALGLWGMAASAAHTSPSWSRARQAHSAARRRWMMVWLGFTLGDGLIAWGLWIALHHGWWWGEVSGSLALLWSVIEMIVVGSLV